MRERERKRDKERGRESERERERGREHGPTLPGGRERGKEGGSMDQHFPKGERERKREGEKELHADKLSRSAPKQEVRACSMCSSFTQSVKMRDYIIHGARMSEMTPPGA